MIPTVFPERVWCRLHPEGAHRGERLQHVRVSGVEEQEAADVCGSERPREAAEREENPQEEHSHPLPSNCGVNWRAWTGEGGHAALDREVFNTEKKKKKAVKQRHSLRNLSIGNKALTLLHNKKKYGHCS